MYGPDVLIPMSAIVLLYAGVMLWFVPWIHEKWEEADRKKYPNPNGDWIDP